MTDKRTELLTFEEAGAKAAEMAQLTNAHSKNWDKKLERLAQAIEALE